MPALKNRWPRTICLGLLVILVAGCATLGNRIEPPRVSLSTIRMQQVRGFETAFEVGLRVLNRSDQPLVIQGLNCELMLSGRQLAEGVANPQVEILPYDSAIISVMVYSSMLDMVGVARRIIKGVNQGANDPIAYEITGHVLGGAAGITGKFPFTSKGDIDLKELAGDL